MSTGQDKKLLLFFMATAPEQEYNRFREYYPYTAEQIDSIHKSNGAVLIPIIPKFSIEELKMKYAQSMLKTWKEYESLLNENN